MTIVVVGNGSVGLMIAHELSIRDRTSEIVVVAPKSRVGCASVAAAAMFNSFAEVDVGTFQTAHEAKKWRFNRTAAPKWPSLLRQLQDSVPLRIESGFGTFVVNNHVSDDLEDENFDAIVDALVNEGEPHEMVSPRHIPMYRPACHGRATRAVLIPSEGWVNPAHLIGALEASLLATQRVRFVDGTCRRLMKRTDGAISSVVLSDGTPINGDVFVLAPGATFTEIVAASQLDITFPRVFYGAGCTLLMETGDMTLPHCIRTPNRGLACGVYCVGRDSAHTIVGASNYMTTEKLSSPHLGSVYVLLKSVIEQVNCDYYRANLSAVNFGWRPVSEDTLPMIGRTALKNLYVATGTKRDGLHCSPLIGQIIADLILTGATAIDIDDFKPDRKPTRVFSREKAVESYVRQTVNAHFQHDFVPAKNRMLDELRAMHRSEIEALHDRVGAFEWGIPPELVGIYRHLLASAK